MNTEKAKYTQQGDVILFHGSTVDGFSGIPEDAKPVEAGRRWLALGEVTGHSHQVTAGDFDLLEKDGVLYLRAKTECSVTHEEHKVVTVPKGDYVIGIVQEYDPFAKAINKVRD